MAYLTDERRSELLGSLRATMRIVKWEKEMTHQEFAEKYVYLPKDNAVGGGRPVDFSRSPHLIKPMQCLDSPHVKEIYLMFASQMAKTLFLYIAFAKNAKMNSKTLVWMIIKKEDIGGYQKTKITNLINPSPVMRQIIEETRVEEKRAQNKVGEISHNGGTTYIIGSNVDGDKKSKSAKIIIADEVDEMSGLDAIMPLWERAKTFLDYGAKLIVASTKKSNNGAITQGFKTCEQKNFLALECPHCGELIQTTHTQFRVMETDEYKKQYGYTSETFTEEVIYEKYVPQAARGAYYECNACAASITSEQRKYQVEHFKIGWIVKGKKIEPSSVGFSTDSFLSFFVPFEEIAKKWIIAKLESDPTTRHKLLTLLYEGYFNDVYEEKQKDKATKNDILLLSNGLNETKIPHDTYKIYLTIDTQKNHFWWTIHAWQYGSIMDLVDYGRAETFEELDLIREQTFTTKYGEVKGIDITAIDRRGIKERTTDVDNWIRDIVLKEGEKDNIYAIEGDSGKTMTTISKYRKHDTIKEIKIIKVNNLMAKDYLSEMMGRSIEKVRAEDGDANYEHALKYEQKLYNINNKPVRLAEERQAKNIKSTMIDFERMMTSEIKINAIDPKTGRVAREKSWEKKSTSIRNDYWDDAAYQVGIWDFTSGALAKKPEPLTKSQIRHFNNQMQKQAPQQKKDFF